MVLQTILNLAEFLEREEELKLYAPSTLASVAERCNASAKALYVNYGRVGCKISRRGGRFLDFENWRWIGCVGGNSVNLKSWVV